MNSVNMWLALGVLLNLVGIFFLARWMKRDYVRKGSKVREMQDWADGRDTDADAFFAVGPEHTDGERYRFLRVRGLVLSVGGQVRAVKGAEMDQAVEQLMDEEHLKASSEVTR